MRKVLLASHGTSQVCRGIVRELQRQVGGSHVSYYPGGDFERLRNAEGFDFSEIGFFILGLSKYSNETPSRDNAGKEIYSKQHVLEQEMILEACKRRTPIGIVGSDTGAVSAPYLMSDLPADLVRLAIMNGPNRWYDPREIYPKVRVFDLSESEDGFPAIAGFIAKCLPTALGFRAEPQVTRRPQMSSSNTGWHNNNLTD